MLKKHKLWFVFFLAILVFVGSLFTQFYGEICDKNEYTGQKDCTHYHIALVALWHIAKILNDYGVAITAAATAAIAAFTWTLWRATTDQGRDRLQKDLALSALRRALVLRRPKTGILHHSDRGSQYCSYDDQRILDRHGFIISMSGKGNCYDNAMVETLFKTIKSELIWRTSFQSRFQAENAIARYIDGFYNPVRRHSALGYKSPINFEHETNQRIMALH